MLRDRLLLGRPQAKIARRPRRELLRHRVVAHALDRVIVRILEDALRLRGPDDDRLVLAAGGEALPVLCVRDAVQRLLMPLERVQQVALDRVVDEHAAADGGDELRARRVEGEVVNARFNALALGHLVGP